MFVEEVFRIVKRGLKCDYQSIENNEKIFKGKLIFTEQIKHNYAHKERSFVQYDDYNSNRPENRLLKSTLQYLYAKSTSIKNRSNIKTLLNEFSDVESSENYESDFAKILLDRNMKDYETALLWSRIFLMGKSFTAFSGSDVAVALLFPMETLFESYIAFKLSKAADPLGYSVTAQDRKYHLFDEPGKRFLLKPDIVAKKKLDEMIFILDTKWKVLSETQKNYGISQSDMYQMYAYQKKYNSENVTLLYPMTEQVNHEKEIFYTSEDGVIVRVKFIDLFNIDESIKEIVDSFYVSESA